MDSYYTKSTLKSLTWTSTKLFGGTIYKTETAIGNFSIYESGATGIRAVGPDRNNMYYMSIQEAKLAIWEYYSKTINGLFEQI